MRISPHGGIVPILRKLEDLKIHKLISSCLGQRVAQAQYSYEDAIIAWILTTYTQGFSMVKIEEAKSQLSIIPDLTLPSHDTIGRLLKKLATDSQKLKVFNPKNPKRGHKHFTINENEQLNDLLIKATKRMGLLKPNVPYTLDIDATIIFSDAREAQPTYKGQKGFAPMVALIGNLPVYIEMRSGNANASFRKKECLEKCIALLKKNNIKVGRIRIDGAGYQNEVLQSIQRNGMQFICGAQWSSRTYEMVSQAKWKKKKFQTAKHVWNAEFCSIPFSFAIRKEKYRICAIRVPKETRIESKGKDVTKWRYEDGYYYKFIITNDKYSSPEALFHEYHQRGTSERNFDYMKNDFGWKKLPFSNLNQNLVYMIVQALAANVFQGLLKRFSKRVKQLSLNSRLQKFKDIVINIPFLLVKNVFVFGVGPVDLKKLM